MVAQQQMKNQNDDAKNGKVGKGSKIFIYDRNAGLI